MGDSRADHHFRKSHDIVREGFAASSVCNRSNNDSTTLGMTLLAFS
jgi:hypothetical protein